MLRLAVTDSILYDAPAEVEETVNHQNLAVEFGQF